MQGIKFEPLVSPKKEIVATCPACGKELSRAGWEHYEEYKRQKRKIEKAIKECPHCKAAFAEKVPQPKWEKTTAGDLIAKAKTGDFLVWKYGSGYKWRYRRYGEEAPRAIYWNRRKEDAQRACAKHEEWVL